MTIGTDDITGGRPGADLTAGGLSLFEAIVVHANDVVLVTDAEPIDAEEGGPRVIYVNPAFTRMTGYEPHEIVGRTPRLMQAQGTDRAELDRLRTALETWAPVEVELLNMRKDGVEFWVQLNITPLMNDDGIYTHWIAIQRDITARRHREIALRSMLDSTSDLLLVIDDAGCVRAVSAASERVLGLDPEALGGSDFITLVHPDERAGVRELLGDTEHRYLGARAAVTARVSAADATWRWLELTAVDLEGLADGSIGVACADVTEHRRVQAALEEVNGRFRSAFDDAPIGMAITDLSGGFIQVNAALSDLLGRPASELLSRRVQDVTHPDDTQHAERHRLALTHGDQDRLRHETRFLHADGSVVGILHSSSVVRDAEGRPTLLIDHIENITERQVFESRLQHQALHDPLTGLPNRALFMDRLNRALSADRTDGGHVAVLFCDIDRFKTINDTYGHHIGDLVLTTIAQRVQSVLRPTDTVGRLGGDELVILCAAAGQDEAEQTASDLRAVLADPIMINGASILVTISVGIAISSRGQVDGEQLLRDSDDAMYAAKHSGKDQYSVYDKASARSNRRRLLLTADLAGAIAGDQLRLHFQPQIDLTTGATVAQEALVRWEHPVHGLLMPGEFIPLAEDAGLMRELGRWVLGEVLTLQSARMALPDRKASDAAEAPVLWLNASATELDDGAFAADVEEALGRHGLRGSSIGIEITESVLMTNLSRAHSNLARLRSLGVRLAIDDFGTGYSSLSYIGQFPVDTVKIDASFVAGLDSPARRRESFAVVTAVISLAHSLGLTVIAEGIESETQALILHGLGCDEGQGYLYGKPQPSGF